MATANIFSSLFGDGGNAALFFGGQWWLVGLFLLLIFAVFMFSEGANGQAIALMVMTGVVVVIAEEIFTILAGDSIYKTILYFLLMFAGWYYYRWTKG